MSSLSLLRAINAIFSSEVRVEWFFSVMLESYLLLSFGDRVVSVSYLLSDAPGFTQCNRVRCQGL